MQTIREINEGAAPQDRVSGEALRNRVRGVTTEKNLSGRNDQINHDPPVNPAHKYTFPHKSYSDVQYFMMLAIGNLDRIRTMFCLTILSCKQEGVVTTAKTTL